MLLSLVWLHAFLAWLRKLHYLHVLCVCSFVCFSFLQFECGFIMVYSVFRKQKYHTKVSDFNVILKKAFLFLYSLFYKGYRTKH